MAVFYSFHYQEDAWRVQQIMNMGVVDGQQINSQSWETVKRQGERAIRNWIDNEMKYKSAVIVLNGTYTAGRPWVQYEIRRAWEIRKPLLAIDINGLKDREGHIDLQGKNPFSCIGDFESMWIPWHQPDGTSQQIYFQIKENLQMWATQGYKKS